MGVAEFTQLLRKIFDEHSPIKGPLKPNYRTIKYVDPVYDNRNGSVFCVKLRGFGQEDATFHVCNEQRDLPDSLYERIVQWLENK